MTLKELTEFNYLYVCASSNKLVLLLLRHNEIIY